MKTLLVLIMAMSAYAAVYDYHYTPVQGAPVQEANNPLFHGDFERIIRYEPIRFTPNSPISFTSNAEDELQKIEASIGEYVKAGLPYVVSVVAHTRTNADKELMAAQKSTFFGSLQDSLMESHADRDESKKVCDNVFEKMKKILTNRKVEEKNILLECRNGSDPLYLEKDGDARDMNYYINVTLYQSK